MASYIAIGRSYGSLLSQEVECLCGTLSPGDLLAGGANPEESIRSTALKDLGFKGKVAPIQWKIVFSRKFVLPFY
jgi:hypothetical protein